MDLTDFLRVYQREHAVTRNVLQAFPADKSAFKPHDRSNTALQLAWTFVLEERMILKALGNQPVLGSGFPKAPDSWNAVLEAFDSVHPEVLGALKTAKEPDLQPVTFFTAPKQTGQYTPVDFLWFMLSDQIHHRGQLSVYCRMAGGKVPSIYGPSLDEPWN
jgi:uncharacterized damage-inducible protein DinB